MRNIFFNIILLFITSSFLNAQSEPQDYLSADFHKDRRANVKSMMPKNSLAVFFSNPVRNRSNDVDYHYHQDPNFYYLTGLKEPNSVLLLFSESQVENDKTYDEIIFVQFRDSIRERWDGKRLGIKGVKSKLGFEMAILLISLKKFLLNFQSLIVSCFLILIMMLGIKRVIMKIFIHLLSSLKICQVIQKTLILKKKNFMT